MTKGSIRTLLWLLCGAALFALAACGGSGVVAAVNSVTITGAPASGTLEVGASVDLDAVVNATGGASRDVAWSSSDESKATVDGNGVVTGVAEGEVTITATSVFDASKSDSVQLMIIAVGSSPVTSVEVTPERVTVNAGDTVQLSAVVSGSAGVSQAVTWSSADERIATVDASGLVTGVATGTTTITATSQVDPSKSGSAEVTVVSCGPTQELTDITTATTLIGIPGCTDYLVNRPEVNVRAALTIQPGVTIAFQQGARLDVEARGSITANGTQAQPITFTGQAKVAGFWDGIRIFSSIPSRLEQVVVAYAGGDGSGDAAGIEVASGGTLELRQSTLHHSANYGLTVQEGGNLAAFVKNTLRENKIAASVRARHLVQLDADNTFTGNTENFIDVQGGTTDADGTWPATTAPYRLVSTEINVANTITVADGVQFHFQGGSRLDVEGSGALNANGSSAGITFRGTTQTPGFWTGVRIFSGTPSTFTGVTFADGGGDGSSDAATVQIASGGRAGFEASSFEGSANYGLSVASNGNLSGFTANAFGGNRVPMLVYTRHLVQLDAASTFTGNAENFIDIQGGTTDAGGTWPAAQTPYRLIATEINVVNAITIADGAEFRFQGGSRLDVEAGGSLMASGTSQGITFTGTSQVPGHWTGIRIFSGASANFDNVTVAYGGGNGSSSAANLYLNSGSLTLTNSTVSNSANYGLYVTGASASVTPASEPEMLDENTFEDNAGGDVYGLPG